MNEHPTDRPMVDDRLLVDTRRAAELLSISPRKLWELTNRHMIPCVRIGRLVRYAPADLAAFVESRRTGRAT